MKRNLFVTSNRLGDAVLTTGVLHHVIRKEPDIPVTVICGTIPKDIFESVPGVKRVIAIRKQKYNKHWLDAFTLAGPRFWHRIIDFRGSLFSVMPARHRHIWKGGDDSIHKAVANARMIGVDEPIPPLIVPTNTEQAHAKQVLALATDPRPILALAPTANFYQKQWHHKNYLALAKSLTSENGIMPGARVAVFGAPGEEEQAKPVVQGLPASQVIDLVGKTTPVEAAALLSQTNLFVGNDSGLMHSAVAVSIPTVGLFGIGKPLVYGPWGDQSLCLVGEPAGQPIHGDPTLGETPLPVSRVCKEVEQFFQTLQES